MVVMRLRDMQQGQAAAQGLFRPRFVEMLEALGVKVSRIFWQGGPLQLLKSEEKLIGQVFQVAACRAGREAM